MTYYRSFWHRAAAWINRNVRGVFFVIALAIAALVATALYGPTR